MSSAIGFAAFAFGVLVLIGLAVAVVVKSHLGYFDEEDEG